MDYMTFISENYVAIILVLVIVLMTIIGYFADKKYSGNALPVEKKIKEKKKKEKKKKEEVKEDIKDDFDMPTDLDPVVNDMEDLTNIDFNDVAPVEPLPVEEVEPVKPISYEEDIKEEDNSYEDIPAELFEGVEQVPTPVEEVSTEIEEVNNNIDEVPTEIEEVNDTVEKEEPIEDVIEDIDDWSTIEPVNEDEGKVSYDEVEAPADTVETSEWNNINSVPLEEENTSDDNITFDGVADEEFKLPTIDKLNDELSNVETDDDDVWKF